MGGASPKALLVGIAEAEPYITLEPQVSLSWPHFILAERGETQGR